MPSRSGGMQLRTTLMRSAKSSATIRQFSQVIALRDAASHIPRIARPSLWRSLVPRFLRRKTDEEKAAARAIPGRIDLEARRTGSTIVVLGLLVGSFAINVIALRRDLVNYTRHTEAKLNLLRDVVQRVKSGEEVDVKKLLGTGDPAREQEWEEMMQELENYNRKLPRQPEPTPTHYIWRYGGALSLDFSRRSYKAIRDRLSQPEPTQPREPKKQEVTEKPTTDRPSFMM